MEKSNPRYYPISNSANVRTHDPRKDPSTSDTIGVSQMTLSQQTKRSLAISCIDTGNTRVVATDISGSDLDMPNDNQAPKP